jgi:aromatic ring-opening dioxygenase catalytic subunit (LigB family)
MRASAPISDTFDAWLTATVEADPATRAQGLAHWDQAPSARLCHPPRAEEHLMPLMVVAGAASEGRGQRVFSDRVLETTLSAYPLRLTSWHPDRVFPGR